MQPSEKWYGSPSALVGGVPPPGLFPCFPTHELPGCGEHFRALWTEPAGIPLDMQESPSMCTEGEHRVDGEDPGRFGQLRSAGNVSFFYPATLSGKALEIASNRC